MRWFLVVLLVLLGLWVGRDYLQLFLYSETEPRPVTARGDLAAMEGTAIEVFEQVAPSVVFVATVEESAAPAGLGGLHGLPPGHPLPDVPQVGMGTGFVWDAAGHIVTNDHVVGAADRIAVRFGSDRQLPAELVGRAPEYEIAVLRVRNGSRTYRPVPLGSSEDLRVGQTVFAIGNPFGLSRTLTQGLVSALERRLPTANGRELRGVIQTDAAINPGNSGGPLLDSAGRLIGVNTAIATSTGAFAGVGFAVPVDVVNRVVATLIREGSVPRPGIGIAALSEELAARLGIDGVAVAEVAPGSPAAAAGLKGIDPADGGLGDVIVRAEGRPVSSVAELAEVLDAVGVGGVAELTVERDGDLRQVQVPVTDISDFAEQG